MTRIPLTRPSIDQKAKDMVLAVLDSGHLTEGPVVRALEGAVRDFLGCGFCLALTSCTTGLETALRALGVGPGDEVVVPDFTYPASAHAVLLTGATVVLADVNPATLLLDADSLAQVLGPATKAVMPVSLFGNPVDWERLHAMKKEHGILMVEDAACSLGAKYGARPVGNQADVTVFSLHPRKPVTSGEGGLVATDSEELAQWMQSYAHFGMRVAENGLIPEFVRLGTNYKMSDILAAVGLAQVERLEELIEARRQLARRYIQLLGDVPGIRLPLVTKDGSHSYQSFCILVEDRDRIMTALRTQDIEVQIGTYALHHQPAFQSSATCRHAASLKNSDWVYEHCLSLPLYPGMEAVDQDRVVEALVRELEA